MAFACRQFLLWIVEAFARAVFVSGDSRVACRDCHALLNDLKRFSGCPQQCALHAQ